MDRRTMAGLILGLSPRERQKGWMLVVAVVAAVVMTVALGVLMALAF